MPAGQWLTTPIELKSRINLHLEAGAVVVFTDEKKYYFSPAPRERVSQDYPPGVTTFEPVTTTVPRSPISARDAVDIAITGPGKLDGNGVYWWPLHQLWWNRQKQDMPAGVYERAWRGLDPKDVPERPKMIRPYRCKNVLHEGFTVVDSPMWTVNPVACENVIVRDLTIRAAAPIPSRHAPNTDGVNPESCRNVLIEDCDIVTGDDSVAIKSGLDVAGRARGLPCENIVVRRLKGRRMAIGSEMSGGVRNVLIEDCEISGALNTLLYIKTRRGRGGVVENIFVRNLTGQSVADAVVRIDMEYWTQVNAAPPEPFSERTPRLRNFEFKNIRTTQPSPRAHAHETALSGSYAVTLDDFQTRVTLTATNRCGFHRYEFAAGGTNFVAIDPKHGNRGGGSIWPEERFVRLNGQPVTRLWLTHDELFTGDATHEFGMNAQPPADTDDAGRRKTKVKILGASPEAFSNQTHPVHTILVLVVGRVPSPGGSDVSARWGHRAYNQSKPKQASRHRTQSE